MFRCVVCGGERASVFMDAAALDREVRRREEFVQRRAGRPLSEGERKDLTDFFHDERAELLECDECGLLTRKRLEEPAAGEYAEEPYEEAAVERQYPEYVKAFRAKEKPYRALLPAGARVVEVGSHYGAFLQVAKEWGWKATGVDVGEDSTRLARAHGGEVCAGELGECRFETGSCDGLFIWNCFDQFEDPKPVVRESARLLKPGGLLVVRTPNGVFYRLCQTLLRNGGTTENGASFLMDAMAYNNLLGFPYQYGYSRGTLERVIEPFGFRREGMLNAELLTLPLPDAKSWVPAEERAVHEGVEMLEGSVLRGADGELTGPWIEVWFRRHEVAG